MRLVFVVSVVLLSLCSSTAFAQPTISFRSRELQEGRNFIKAQIAVPHVAEASGAIDYSYKIDLPAGRGVTPVVELQYSSLGRFSQFGWGWELTIPTIERTQRFGVADYTSNLFMFREGHTTHELVPTGMTTPLGGTEYKERIEKTFRRYIFYQASNQWRILVPNGVRLELGTANSSRRGANPNLGPSGTSEWLVSRIIDANNNYATYEYENGFDRLMRIKTIRYNGNAGTGVAPLWTVTFSWVSQFSALGSGFRSGFRKSFGGDRLTGIVVNVPAHAIASGNPAFVPASSPTSRSYTFTYSDVFAATDNVFHLLSVQQAGLPPVSFSYSNPTFTAANDSQTLISTTGEAYPGHLGFTEVTGFGESLTRSTLVDGTGDARLDLVDAYSVSDDTWTIWINESGRMRREFWTAPLDLTDTRMWDRHALRVTQDGKTFQDYFDLDGDRYPDLVWHVVSGGTPLIKFCPGNGSGFDPCGFYGGGAPGTDMLRYVEPTASSDTSVTTLDLADMDGDGRSDILKLVGSQLYVYRNRGLGIGFDPTPLVSVMPACPSPWATACLRATQDVVVPGGNRRQLADLRDVNGDGLVDYIVNDMMTNELRIAFGNGRAFQPFVSTGKFRSIGLGQQATGSGDYTATADMLDVNGDSLADFVEMDCGTGSYTVWFNSGGYWDTTPRVYQASAATAGHVRGCLDQEEPAKVDGMNGVAVMSRLVDFTGDGLADFASAPFEPGFPESIRVGQQSYRAPRKLLTASTSTTHVLSIDWAVPFGNGPTPVHVPFVIRRNITPTAPNLPSRATQSTTVYTFEGGSFDPDEREFAGFATVLAEGPPWGVTTSTTYGTTLVQRGLVLASRSTNNSALGVSEGVVNQYTYVNLGNGRTFAQLDRTYRGPLPTPQLPQPSVLTTFENYNAFGQPTRWIDWGRELGAPDEYVNERDFVVRSDDNFLIVVPIEERKDTGTTMTAAAVRTRKYYDNHATFGDTPTAGNVVKVQRSRDAATWLTTEFWYDANGNVTQETDPAGYASMYAYDPTFARFRVRISNSLGTIFRSYHALSDVPADECGPQFSGTSYRCSRSEVDAFGREISHYVPAWNGSVYTKALLTQVTYNDFAYPTSTVVVKRGTQRAIQYRDGFGNVTQVRIEESPNLFRVFDSLSDADGRTFRVEQTYRASGTAYAYTPISLEAWTYEHDAVHGTIERVTHPRDFGDTSPAATASRTIEPDRTVMVDEDLRRTDYMQDGYRRVTSSQRYDGSSTYNTLFTYDVHNEVASMTDATGNVTSYQRNLAGWLTSITPPQLGSFTYTHNARGQVTSTLDQRGVTVTYGYDTPGRLVSLTSSGGPTNVRPINASLTYYTPVWDSKQLNWLRTETSDDITQTYSYTPEQAIASHTSTRTANGTTWDGTVQFRYDVGARLNGVTFPDGQAITYNYNLADEISTVTEPSKVLASYLYEDDGQISVVTNDLGLSEGYSYDARGRRLTMISTNTLVTEGDLVDDVVSLSKAGDVLTLTRRGLKPGRIPRSTPEVLSITTDSLHQVTRVDRDGVLAAQYAYDAAGKLLSFNEAGTTTSSTSTYVADRLTRRITGIVDETWTYDAAGAVTDDDTIIGGTRRVRRHTWDALQRYAKTQVFAGPSTEYFYTPTGRVSRVVSPGESTSTSDELVIGDWARLDMTTGIWTKQVNANDTVVVEITGARYEMPHRTLQETVGAVSNDQGLVLRQEEFAPFGTRNAGSGDGRFPQHFHGLRADKLVVTAGRAYDPEMGAWLSRDLAQRDPDRVLEDPRLANAYAFNFSNPFSYRDPSGEEPADKDKAPDTAVLYIVPPDIVHTVDYKDKKGPVEYRWTIQEEAMKKQYEKQLGNFLVRNKVLGKGAKVAYGQLTNIRDVANLVNKDTTSLVLIVHGLSDAPVIATQLPNGANGSKGDAIKADDFAKLLSGSGVKSVTVLGCDTVSNKFAPNLADVLPAGGTVKGFAGSSLEVVSSTEAKKSKPGVLTLTRVYTKGKLQVTSFKTKGP